MKKRWLKILLVMACLLAAVLGGAHWYVSKQLTPEAVQKRLEKMFQAQAQLDGVQHQLIGSPASVSIHGLMLVPQDPTASLPHAGQRPRLTTIGESGLSIGEAKIAIHPLKLLQRRIETGALHLGNVRIGNLIEENGHSSLQKIFSKVEKEPEQKDPNAPKPVADKPLSFSIPTLTIDNFRYDSRSLIKRQTTSIHEAKLTASDLRFDLDNLATHNHAKFDISGKLLLLGKRKVEQMNLGFDAAFDGAILDVETKQPAALALALNLHKGSRLTDLPALQRMAEKTKKWEKYGLKLQAIPDDAVLTENAPIQFLFKNQKLSVQNEVQLILDNYEVQLGKGSFVDTGNEMCSLEISFLIAPSLSQQALKDFSASLKDKLGDGIGSNLFEKVSGTFASKKLLLDDGRLRIPMKLTGPLDKPEVSEDIGDVLKDALFEAILPL